MYNRLTSILVMVVLLGTAFEAVAKNETAQDAQQHDKKKKKKKKKPTGTHMIWIMAGDSTWKRDAVVAMDVARSISAHEKNVIWAIPYLEPPLPEEGVEELATQYKNAKKHYKKGKKWLKKERFKRSIKEFSKARELLDQLVAKAGYIYKFRKRLAFTLMYMGAVHMAQGETEQARTLFRRVCSFWPGFPAPKMFTDTLREFYVESCKMSGKGTGIIVVNSSQPGFFFVDGRLMGVTPGRVVKVEPGVHYVTWGRMGYDMMIKEVRVSEGGTAVADFTVKRAVYYPDIQEYQKTIEQGLQSEGEAEYGLLGKIAKKVRVRRVLVVRDVGRRVEVSYLDRKDGWLKRVRRTFKGGELEAFARTMVGVVMKPAPKFDFKDPVVRRKRHRCYSDSDCSVGKECVKGRCVRATPIYKKWWFWTAIGAGTLAVGGGGYLLYELSNRPSIELRPTP